MIVAVSHTVSFIIKMMRAAGEAAYSRLNMKKNMNY